MTIKVRKLPSGKYQSRYTGADGKQFSAGTFKGVREAQRAAAAKEAEVSQRQWHDPNRGKMRFSEFAPRAMRLHAPHVVARSLSNMESNVRLHLMPLFGDYSLRDITSDLVQDWWLSMPPNSARRASYFSLRTILNYAVEAKHIDSSPCSVKKASKDVSTPRPPLSEEDAFRLIDACSPDMRVFLLVLLGGAFRVGEALALSRGHVNMETGVVTVERTEIGGEIVHRTKTKKPRKVALPSWSLEALAEYLQRHPMLPASPLFLNPQGNRLSRSQVYRALALARADTGLEWAHTHDLRHTGLTMAMLASGDLIAVTARAGHGDMRSALRYQNVSQDRDMAIAASMGKWRATGS